MALMTGDSLYWKTRIDNTGLKTGAVQAKGILRGLARSITGMDIFAGLAIGATLVFSKMTKQAYNFSKDFETAMREVQTISKAVQNDFKGISQEIIDMSKTVPDTAQKLTKALYQIVSAGYDGAKAMEILRVSTELAVATVTDTFTAADALTYVMNAYGAAAGTASEISDKLFTIIRLGKVKMEELGPTLSMVTGLAAEAGMSFNDLGAFYAEAVKKIQPRIVSTGIRGFVTALLRASKEGQASAKAAKEMGIEFDIATLKSKGLEYMLKQMAEATEGQKQKLMELFPNVRGLIGLLAIMTDEGANFNKTLNEIENSLGATDEAFKTMVETTESQWAILKNNVMAKMKPLGDSLLKFMNNIASGINIAMSGANDELSRLARSYSELTDTLKRKQNRIDDLIATIEDLRSKTELTREETTELEAAERALIILLPDLGKAFEDAAGKVDILTIAKEATIDLSIRIMELELAQAEIEKRRAKLAKDIYDKEEDEGKKEINRIKGQMIVIEELTEFEIAGVDKRRGKAQEEIYTKEKLAEMVDASLEKNNEYLKLQTELSLATEKRGLEEEQLTLNIEKTTLEVDALTEALERLKETREKPIKPPAKPRVEGGPEVIPVILTDEQIKKIKDNLKYMADQYRRYLSDIAQFGEKYVEEHNARLAEEGKNYAKYLSDMATKYKDNAELNRIISDDVYEYNKGIIAKRKEAEEEYFSYIAEARERDLADEEKRFKSVIKILEEGSTEYLNAIEKHKENEKEINLKYDKAIAEGKLTILKESLERQVGEEDEAYRERYKKSLKIAKADLGEKTKINKEFFEFIEGKLKEITDIEEEEAKEKKRILESYFKDYYTTEEKIVAIHKRTNELLKLTDDKYEQDRLRNIEKQLIAEVKFGEAKQEIDEKIAEYGEELNNEQLEEFIRFLEKMKLKYAGFADIIILLDEKIAESQKRKWENTREELDKTIDALHALADVVGNFDAELGEMINDLADLISGIGDIKIDFSTWGGFAGTLTGILGIINTIINLFVMHKSDVPELRKELAEITLELQKQQNILSQAIGTAKVDAIQDTIDLLEEQINKYNEMIAAEEAAYGQFLWWTWDETDAEKIEQWLASIEATEAEIVALWQQYREILTGITATSIADAIADGFTQGLDSAQIFADTFNNMMEKAIIDAFKRTIITKFIEEWYEQFAAAAEEGLTAAEIEALKTAFQAMLEATEEEWEAFKDILEAAGIDLGEQLEEIIETIAGITEESIADAIADGFAEGLTPAEVFADNFNEMMRKAMIDAFKQTIIIEFIKDWYKQFAEAAEEGLTAEEIEALKLAYQEMLEAAGVQWEIIQDILEAVGIGFEEIKDEIEIIAGITEESIADAIADGFAQGLDSAEVFADTFNDMMRKAIIDAFKQTILTKYIEAWYEQFAILTEGGLTAEEIEILMGTYQEMLNAAGLEWEAIQDILDALGLGLEDIKVEGLTGAIAGITEETAGLLAGQFQAIRINTVDILTNMENIIIINSRIADNTEYNKYLKDINDKLGEGRSSEIESLRGIGGA